MPQPESLRILPAPPTPLVGRQRELAAVIERLSDSAVRLVTITGSPGVGKTRLALEAGAHLASGFAGGVAFVRLDTARDPEEMLTAIGRVLDLRAATDQSVLDALIRHLRGRHLVLVLDNLEQILPAAVDLAELLAACPTLALLATSRAALRIRGEHELPLGSLDLPAIGGDAATPADGRAGSSYATIAAAPAVQLFVQRARAVRPEFALDQDNAWAVAAICARLDGLPLAIELAAARSGMFAPAALLARLIGASDSGPQHGGATHASPLRFLIDGPRDLPARQQTLRDAIAWSHDLLSPEERALFRRLSAFVGGWTLPAAGVVCGGDGDDVATIDGMAALLQHNLIARDEGPDDTPRFAMLATIHEYAEERLAASGEADAVHWRHFDYFLTFAEEGKRGVRGPDQPLWSRRHELEGDNLRAALGRSLASGDPADMLRLATTLMDYWDMRGAFSEAADWLERGLAAESIVPPTLRIVALRAAGTARSHCGEQARGVALLEESVALAEAQGDRTNLARSLNNLGNALSRQGDFERSARVLERCLALRRQVGDARGTAGTLGNLAAAHARLGRFEEAARSFEDLLGHYRAEGDREGMARASQGLGNALSDAGDVDRAIPSLEESLALYRELRHRRGLVTTLNSLAGNAVGRGDAPRALAFVREALAIAREATDQEDLIVGLECRAGVAALQGEDELEATLLASVTAVREAKGWTLPPLRRPEHERRLHGLRTSLGEDTFSTVWAAGGRLSLHDAAALALRDDLGRDGAGPPPGPARLPASPLTPRERQIAVLIAQGLSNRAIAERLVISKRTADTHVTNILNRLGFSARAQVAVWAAEQGLTANSPG